MKETRIQEEEERKVQGKQWMPKEIGQTSAMDPTRRNRPLKTNGRGSV
jgi:hypothetical protein